MKVNKLIVSTQPSHRVFWAGGIPWGKYKGTLRPLAPPYVEPKLCPEEIKNILRESKAPLAMWTYDFDSTNSRSWWWLIAEKPYSLEMLNKKSRYEIRFGLKTCSAKIISGKQIADVGFDCYKSAMRRHAQTVPEEEAIFKRTMLSYDNSKEYEVWGVFVNDRLSGYGTCRLIADTVILEDAIFDPEYFKYRQSYALMHVMTDYYLNKKQYLFFTTGTRSISHETQFQDFLIRNLRYRKAYCKLGIAHTNTFRILFSAVYRLEPIWQIFPCPRSIKDKLKVVHKLETVIREQGADGIPLRSSTINACS
jgi:hypothetical protein